MSISCKLVDGTDWRPEKYVGMFQDVLADEGYGK